MAFLKLDEESFSSDSDDRLTLKLQPSDVMPLIASGELSKLCSSASNDHSQPMQGNNCLQSFVDAPHRSRRNFYHAFLICTMNCDCAFRRGAGGTYLLSRANVKAILIIRQYRLTGNLCMRRCDANLSQKGVPAAVSGQEAASPLLSQGTSNYPTCVKSATIRPMTPEAHLFILQLFSLDVLT